MLVNQRKFCAGASAALLGAQVRIASASESNAYQMVARSDRERILRAAEKYLKIDPVTITAFRSSKSPGGPHNFFSQADYFWPNPKNPTIPYIYRDGQSNPDNFIGHRKAIIDLSIQMPALTSAWLLTKDRRYARHAGDHLRAWFASPDTRMNPNLEFAQGIHGIWQAQTPASLTYFNWLRWRVQLGTLTPKPSPRKICKR